VAATPNLSEVHVNTFWLPFYRDDVSREYLEYFNISLLLHDLPTIGAFAVDGKPHLRVLLVTHPSMSIPAASLMGK
jgi:hypothetical protein